jgi:hypothetical protein
VKPALIFCRSSWGNFIIKYVAHDGVLQLTHSQLKTVQRLEVSIVQHFNQRITQVLNNILLYFVVGLGLEPDGGHLSGSAHCDRQGDSGQSLRVSDSFRYFLDSIQLLTKEN